MDYKEKYEQALEVAKETYNKQPMYREWLEKMFPELAESEDERVRKALVRFHKSTIDIDGIKGADIISWLEKQGKPSDEEMKTILRSEYEKGRADAIAEMQMEWSEEEIEKAAQEWDSKANFNPFYMTMEGNKPTGVKQDITTHEESFKAGVNWILKSIKGRVQPKQEWSEEDERNSSYICAALDCYYRLREERNNTNGQECLDKARNWLHNKIKSLRPQNRWKPSDEQMEALNYVVNLMASSESPKENDYYYNVFKDLRKQLKKLKEGKV